MMTYPKSEWFCGISKSVDRVGLNCTDHHRYHRSHRSLGNGTDPSKFFKYGSKSIKYGLELPDNHSEVPMASKLVVVPILTQLAIYIYTYGTKWAQWAAKECSLNAPGTENPLSHSNLKLHESPLPIISPQG